MLILGSPLYRRIKVTLCLAIRMGICVKRIKVNLKMFCISQHVDVDSVYIPTADNYFYC